MKPNYWSSHLIWLRPRTKKSKREIGCLKDQILQRLKTEDYTCRLPRPRVRYKLRRVLFFGRGVVWK